MSDKKLSIVNILRWVLTVAVLSVMLTTSVVPPGALIPGVNIPVTGPETEETPPVETPVPVEGQPTPVPATGGVSWTIQIDKSVPAQEVSAMGGEDAVKNSILDDLKGTIQDPTVSLDVTAAGEAEGVANYQITAQGTTTLDQFREVVFVDMAGQTDLLGGTVALTINGTATEGQAIPVMLESNPSTGSSWSVAGLDESKITQEGETSFDPRNDRSVLGAPAKQLINLRGVGSGDTTITMAYNRPWEVNGQSDAASRITLNLGALPETIDLTNPDPKEVPERLMESAGPEPGLDSSVTAESLPSAYDWRSVNGTNYVTDIRNQGNCGSCYAFSMVGTMESALKRAGVTADLSEQFLVSCTTNYNYACNGGYMDTHRFHYNINGVNQTAPGAVLDSLKPYTATNGTCSTNYAKAYKLASWNYITGNWWTKPTVDQIKNAIYNYGPVSAAVYVGSKFQAYSGGIFTTSEYNPSYPTSTNHAIVLVGWGTDGSGNTYWILRNSWGSNWGEGGYMRILATASNVGTEAAYVTYSDTGTPDPGPTPTPEPEITTFDSIDYATGISVNDAGSFEETISTTDATLDTTYDPVFPSTYKYFSTVWYKFTPDVRGTITLSTTGSNYDTVLGVWKGTKGSLTNVAWNDDMVAGVTDSQISTTLLAGTTYYIEAASYDDGGGELTFSMDFAEIQPLEEGIYDDKNDNFLYNGTWFHDYAVSTYASSLSWTKTAGSNAELLFSGNRAALMFSRKNGYGLLKVDVKDSTGAVVTTTTINQNLKTTVNQDRWNTGPLGGVAPYTFLFTNLSTKPVDIDAITIANEAGSETTGTVEDSSDNMVYTGFWKTADDPLDSGSNTLGISSGIYDKLVLKFSGRQAALVYNRSLGNGTMSASITDNDGSVVSSASIIENSKKGVNIKETWNSGDLGANGPFTLTITHTAGGPVNIDQVILKDAAETVTVSGTQTVDNPETPITYRGFWKQSTGISGPYSSTIAESATIGDSAKLTFVGSRIAVLYTMKKGAGSMSVTIRDSLDNVVSSGTIVENNKSQLNQQVWNSGQLGENAQYTVTIAHVSGGAVTLDAITLMDAASQAMGATENIETDKLVYKGFWSQTVRTGATNNNLAVSPKIGDNVSFTINGRQVGIIFARDPKAGFMTVEIKKVSTGATVVDPVMFTQKSATKTPQLQQQWLSGDLGSSEAYTVMLSHASGGNVTLDGANVGQGTTARLVAGSQAGDESTAEIDYAGFWTFSSGLTGPDGGTLARSTVKESTAKVQFNGTKVSVFFTKELKGGIMQISIDGGVPVQVNEMSKTTLYGQSWVSPVLAEGDHTLLIKHYWGSLVNIDMVKVE